MTATACARLSEGWLGSVAIVTTVRQRSSSALVSPLSSRPATMATGPPARSRTSSAAASLGRSVRRLAARSRPVSTKVETQSAIAASSDGRISIRATKSAVLCAIPSIRHGSNTSGSTSRMRSTPKFLAMRTALAMLTMSWGLTRTRMGDTAGACRPASSLAEEGDVIPLRLERRGEPGLLDGLHVRFLRLYLLRFHQLHQRVVEGDHAHPPVGLHDRWDLKGLSLANQVGHRRDRKQDLAGGHPPAADLLAQGLRDHAPERLGEHHPHLRLPVGRKLIDDAVDRGGGRRGMERTED